MQHTEEEELRAIYYAHYDRLPEPWKSECKENWSYEYAKENLIPETAEEALRYGFVWRKKGEFFKWNALHDMLINNEIPLAPKFDEAKFQSLVSKDHPPVVNKLVEEQDFIDAVKKDFYYQFNGLYCIDEVYEYFEIYIRYNKQQ